MIAKWQLIKIPKKFSNLILNKKAEKHKNEFEVNHGKAGG